jgi:DNA-binding response OmpR family regulator
MDWLPRVLILDSDLHTLISLQRALEEAEIHTTITWEEAEACQLLESSHFDLILIGDHPPELNAAAVVDDLSFRGTCPSVLILRAVVSEKDAEYFRRLGAIGVVQKGDPLAVLDQVTKTLAPTQFKAKATTGLIETRFSRAA